MNYEMFIFMLVFAHFLADYVFQTAWISKMKKTKRWPMIVHCFIYTGCIGTVLMDWVYDLSWWVIGAIFVSHWLIDNFRIYLVNAQWRKETEYFVSEEDDWLPTFVDQSLHFLVLLSFIIRYR